MDKFKPKPDTGTLFINGFKSKEKHPDYTGRYSTKDGEVRDFAAWLSEKEGRQYLSVRFSDQYVETKSA